jgi:hypothetical protein
MDSVGWFLPADGAKAKALPEVGTTLLCQRLTDDARECFVPTRIGAGPPEEILIDTVRLSSSRDTDP